MRVLFFMFFMLFVAGCTTIRVNSERYICIPTDNPYCPELRLDCDL